MYVNVSDPSMGPPPTDPRTRVYQYDAGNFLIYEGWAKPGSAYTDPVWAIRKYTYTGGNLTLTQWADGNTAEDNIWANAATLQYF